MLANSVSPPVSGTSRAYRMCARPADTSSSATIGEADFERLRQHGFTDSDIWDIGSVAAFFSLSNRMANMADMRPNREFYRMGRGEG